MLRFVHRRDFLHVMDESTQDVRGNAGLRNLLAHDGRHFGIRCANGYPLVAVVVAFFEAIGGHDLARQYVLISDDARQFGQGAIPDDRRAVRHGTRYGHDRVATAARRRERLRTWLRRRAQKGDSLSQFEAVRTLRRERLPALFG